VIRGLQRRSVQIADRNLASTISTSLTTSRRASHRASHSLVTASTSLPSLLNPWLLTTPPTGVNPLVAKATAPSNRSPCLNLLLPKARALSLKHARTPSSKSSTWSRKAPPSLEVLTRWSKNHAFKMDMKDPFQLPRSRWWSLLQSPQRLINKQAHALPRLVSSQELRNFLVNFQVETLRLDNCRPGNQSAWQTDWTTASLALQSQTLQVKR